MEQVWKPWLPFVVHRAQIQGWFWGDLAKCDSVTYIVATMTATLLSIRAGLDRFGLLLSGLCAIHCVASVVVVSVLGLGGEALLKPAIHEIGLVLAIAVGVLTLGLGALRHRRRLPLLIGAGGIALMAAALAVSHGPREALLTIAGVALVAAAHLKNMRAAAH